jgi:peroxiredoxin
MERIARPSTGYFLFLLMVCIWTVSCNKDRAIAYQDAITKCGVGTTNGFPAPSCIVGAAIPQFQSRSITGKLIDDQYFKGKTTVVNFWFTGCEPCIAEIPGLNKLVATYGKEKINYLAISRDGPKWVKPFLKDHPWDFDHVANGRKLIEDVFASKWGYPLTLVVDQHGVILEAFSGGRTDSLAPIQVFERLSAIVKEKHH